MQEVIVCVPGGRESHVEVSGDTKSSSKRVDTGDTIYYELEPGESITIKVPGGAVMPRRCSSAPSFGLAGSATSVPGGAVMPRTRKGK